MGGVHDDKIASVYGELTHTHPQRIYADTTPDAWYWWDRVPNPKDSLDKWLYLFRLVEIREIRRNKWRVMLLNLTAAGEGEGDSIETAFVSAIKNYQPHSELAIERTLILHSRLDPKKD